MPTYDYLCADCGGFEALRPMARRDEACSCPRCGAAAPRMLAGAPGLAYLEGSTRLAIETNERSAHRPRSSSDAYGRLRHPAGCGCCSPASRRAPAAESRGVKGFPSKRPWMISH